MTDVSDQLLLASKARHPEDESLARLAASALDGTLNWEPGENWATVVKDESVLAHVHVRSPLVVCLQSTRVVLAEALGPDTAFIEVTGMDEPELTADPESLTSLFDDDFAHWEEMKPGGFAASDLWWSTVA